MALDASDEWRERLLVITADCDLAMQKHGGAITCVSLLTLPDYVLRFRVDKLCSQIELRLIEELVDVVSASAHATVSAPRMREWIVERHAAAIAEELRLASPFRQQFLQAAEHLDHIRLARSEGLRELVEAIGAARSFVGSVKTKEKGVTSAAKDLASLCLNLPGDAMYFNRIGAGFEEGYVAYLRRAIEVREQGVARSMRQLPYDAEYVRISRVQAPYLYALTQKFAAVFSAIGLPTEYESERDSRIEGMLGFGSGA